MRRATVAVGTVVLLVTLAAAPAAAVGPPGDAGPPGFVADLVPDVFGDLLGSLPVPNVVKAFVGAPIC